MFSQALSPADRAGLYSDVFALADAGLLNYTVALDFSRNLASESDYVPWDAMTTTFVVLQRLLASSDAYQSFKVDFFPRENVALEKKLEFLLF